MSSILKALKKIEESAPPEESLNPAQAFNPRTVFGQRHRGRWLTSKSIYLGLAAVLLLGAGILVRGWMWGEAEPHGGKPAATAADSAPAGTDAFRAKLPGGKTAALEPPAAPPRPSSQTESAAVPAPTPADAPKAPPAQAAKPAARAVTKEKPQAPSAERPTALAQKPAPARETPPPGRPPAARTPEDNLSQLDDSKLKVMAIAWNRDAARRIAVINGHIVKEGESVDGYTLTQIRKDDVIVNDGARSWRIEFALKVQP